jgi:anti-sigma-K factor RskA
MNKKEHECCQDLLSYLVGELSPQERKEFEQHLQECSICRDELQELQPIWNSLPLSVEEVDPPADLKAEVFSSIFPDETTDRTTDQISQEENQEQLSMKKRPTEENRWRSIFRSGMGKVAVILLFLLVGVTWNNIQLRGQLLTLEEELTAPAQIVQAYAMVAADSDMQDASGSALILQNGDQKRLVVHMNGLASTKGEEAYQVWLVNNGKRHNAGTFRVDETGRGVITYYFDDPNMQFESIGITIEPDPYGDQPRGKKVSGTI